MSPTNRAHAAIRRHATPDRSRPAAPAVRAEELPMHRELLPPGPAEARARLERTIRETRTMLVEIATCRLRSRDDAEDLVQAICLEVLEGEILLADDACRSVDVLVRTVVYRSTR